jgi:predicted ATPase/DNA-binding SARP family transcriptional activator
VDVRILGPLEVCAAGSPVALGGAKPRTLLVLLLLHRGRVVAVDALVEALWGERPPPGALSALRAYVSRVRAALEAGGERRRLRFRGGGYVLEVADAELDAAVAQRLVDTARGATPEEALPLLDDALGRWRGEPLAEFAELDDARAEAARLDELRAAAVEQRAGALLALGRAGAVADLEALVARYPHREHATVLLMRALYAADRQADALAAYDALRHRLREDLGVDPAEPARALHRRILAHDPALAPPPAAAPGNLPRRAAGFVGRAAELAAVSGAVRDRALVTLTGTGGVGKSRLALEVAGHESGRYPDGAWLAELAPLPDGGPVGHAVAAALGVQQRQGLDIDGSVIAWLRRRRLLLVLDNCEHVLDAAARLTDEVVARCPGVAVLATSRAPLGVDGEQVWPLPPLPPDDAAELFVRRARAHRPDALVEPGPVAEICRRLDGLPLAIELAAARTRAMSAAEVARRLDDGRLLAGGTRTADPRHRSLDAAIGWSYDLLAPAEQALFARLSVFAGAVDLDAVHGVCAAPGHTPFDTLDLLTALVDRSMVVAVPAGGGTRYRVLETLRAYGRDRLRDAGEERASALRHAEWCADLAVRAARGAQGADEARWVARVLPLRDDLRAASGRAHAAGATDVVARLVTALPEVLHVRVGYESADWAERALDLVPPEHPLFVAAVGAAARGAWNRGDFPHARALAARAGGRRPGPGTARVAHPGDVLADVALYEGDVAAARAHYEAEVAAARCADEPVRLVWALYYVAVCHAVQRTSALGLAAARESRDVADACGNPTARSMARYALGLVRKKTEPQRALALFDEAEALAAGVHNFWWRGIAMMEAAATRAVHGDPAAAAAGFLRVLDHWERVGDWSQQWLALRYVLRLLVRLGPDAAEGAVALHHALLAAGRPSPLAVARLAELQDVLGGPRSAAAADAGRTGGGAGAVELARTLLRSA